MQKLPNVVVWQGIAFASFAVLLCFVLKFVLKNKSKKQQLLEKPWNNMPEAMRAEFFSEKKQLDLIRYLKEKRPRAGKEHWDIIVIGPTGCGKSTGINTLHTSVCGPEKILPSFVTDARTETVGSTTLSLRKYTLPGTCIRLWDIFGFNPGTAYNLLAGSAAEAVDSGYSAFDKSEFRRDFLVDLLSGKLREGVTYDPKSGSLFVPPGDSVVKFDAAILFVPYASAFDDSLPMWKTYRQFDELCRKHAGINCSLFLSKADKALTSGSLTHEQVFHSVEIRDALKTCSELVGIPSLYASPFIGYHDVKTQFRELGSPVEILALFALFQVMERASEVAGFYES